MALFAAESRCDLLGFAWMCVGLLSSAWITCNRQHAGKMEDCEMGKVSVRTHRGRSIICDEVARSQSLHKSGYAKAALYFVLPIEKEDCEMGREAAHRRPSNNIR